MLNSSRIDRELGVHDSRLLCLGTQQSLVELPVLGRHLASVHLLRCLNLSLLSFSLIYEAILDLSFLKDSHGGTRSRVFHVPVKIDNVDIVTFSRVAALTLLGKTVAHYN